MDHSIAGDGIHLLVAPSVGVDGAVEVGLLVQDVVPLEHDGHLLATQETVGKLRVPYQLIGVERGIGISAFAVAVEVG